MRDPRDIIVSGYHYHLWTTEPWCAVDRGADGKTYQERLNEASRAEGIALEIERARDGVLGLMERWNYDDPNVLELRFEDLMEASRADYRAVFAHYGFEGRELELCVDLMEMLSFRNITRRAAGQVRERRHLRSGSSGGWRAELDESHRARVKELFGPLLVKLGYENDDSW